jgi:hypothetical protein
VLTKFSRSRGAYFGNLSMDKRRRTRILQKCYIIYGIDSTRSVCDVKSGIFNTEMKANIPSSEAEQCKSIIFQYFKQHISLLV